MNISIINAPTYYGAAKEGPEKGPAKLKELDIVSMLKKYCDNVTDDITVEAPYVPSEDVFKANPNIRFCDSLLAQNTELAEVVSNVMERKNFPLIIGGDHSIAIGTVSGVSKNSENLAVIWMDAHSDINTPESSPTKNGHGMPVSMLTSDGSSGLNDILFKGVKIKDENLFLLGQREIDDGEKIIIRDKNYYLRSSLDIRKQGIKNVMNEVFSRIKANNVSNVHLSFDLDFIDKELVPGTGTRVEDGSTLLETYEILRIIAESGYLKSMDLVELNVDLDIDDKTAKIAYDVLETVFKELV